MDKDTGRRVQVKTNNTDWGVLPKGKLQISFAKIAEKFEDLDWWYDIVVSEMEHEPVELVRSWLSEGDAQVILREFKEEHRR